MCFVLEKQLIIYHSHSTVIILLPETKFMGSVERVCQCHCSPLGEQACVSLVLWVGRFSPKYQNFYVFKLWSEWRPFSSYVWLSKQRVSKATVIWWTWYLTIQPVTEILAFHNLPVSPIYMDVTSGATAAIAYKDNDLVVYKCGQCWKCLRNH